MPDLGRQGVVRAVQALGVAQESDEDTLRGVESVIADENVAGNGVVTIAAGDAYFKTSGCTDGTKTG
ncbi:hypothetical protein [Streptomyces cinnamoneus]|uniref:hypothetical protein n=1 Tax=Streptomyces cinnamoneus TaxID=53446 RepID=UPI0015E36B4A|nr:hypothetical protein [Streptomyces cinnamoneus]